MKFSIKAALSTIAGWFLGLPLMIQGLLIFQCLDIATGLLAGGREKNVSSDISYRGMRKKAMMWILVASAWAIQRTWQLEFDVPLAAAVAGFFCLSEAISIVENAARIGLPIPSALAGLLKTVQQGGLLRDQPNK